MSLETPLKIRILQRKLYQKAKEEPMSVEWKQPAASRSRSSALPRLYASDANSPRVLSRHHSTHQLPCIFANPPLLNRQLPGCATGKHLNRTCNSADRISD